MGQVRAVPQVNQAGQQSGLQQLEITYGGLEAPFGGIDSSAPPAYIDPKCFADSDGFFIVNNKLCAVSLQPFSIPDSLWDGTLNVILIKIGTFYNSIYGQLSYALGYTVTDIGGPPSGVSYTFYMTAWNPKNLSILGNDSMNVKLYDRAIDQVFASITIPVVRGATNTGSAGNLGVVIPPAGLITTSYLLLDIPTAVANLCTAINGTGGIAITAAPTVDGLGIIFTSSNPGTSGNGLEIFDGSSSATVGNVPALFLPISNTVPTFLEGGKDATVANASFAIDAVSTTAVGGTLYIANLGPMILKYSGPGTLAISSMYSGQGVIRKFGGSLIGLRNIPQLGTILQNLDMIFSWSAPNNLDEWSPINAAGLVTGAGFEQLADVEDALTGLIVSNNTAYIIRAQGISYATATGNGTIPFLIAHVALGHLGEGAQDSELVCQYDTAGAFVGNSNIFQVSGSISPIGDKIKTALFAQLQEQTTFLDSDACAVFIGGETCAIYVFLIDGDLYHYNTSNGTWMHLSYNIAQGAGGVAVDQIDVQYSQQLLSDKFEQSELVLAQQDGATLGTIPAPVLYSLAETVPNINSLSPNAFVTFPQEEILLGRDVTIDALYISLWAAIPGGLLSPAQGINFLINGVIFGSAFLSPANWNTLEGNPTEIKVFPSGAVLPGTGVFTAHSPQLTIELIPRIDDSVSQVRFAKIQMYASIEPMQRPV